MQNIHDKGYKKLFSNKVIFRQLIETFVKEDWTKDIDFEDCETLDKSFVSGHYKETESDIIYRVKLKDKEAYIFILIEFQSSVDHFMALRMLNYITNFYMDYVESNKNMKKLPPVFPVLLYNGDNRWTAPTDLSELIESNELLGRFSLNFEYFKIAENEYSREALLKMHNIVSTLFLAESYYDIELLKNEFLTIFESEKDKQAISLFLNWFKQLSEHHKIDKSDYRSLEHIYEKTEEVKTMLITALEKERKKLFEDGMEKGIEKGTIETAKRMHAKGMSISFISEVTRISEEKLLKILSL